MIDNHSKLTCFPSPPFSFQGVGNNLALMEALFNLVPRDADYDSVLLTTVDPTGTNMRVKAVSKIIKGFGLYLVLFGTNNIQDHLVHQRFLQMLIAANKQPSSGPTDIEGLHYLTRLRKRFEKQAKKNSRRTTLQAASTSRLGLPDGAEPSNSDLSDKDMDKVLAAFEDEMENEYCLRKRILRNSQNPKCSNKGPRPSHEDLKKWAPFHSSVHSAAGNFMGLMHKAGMYLLRINYGVAAVSRFTFDFMSEALKCLMNEEDMNAKGRYWESSRTRMVTESVHRTTFMSMATCEDLDAAVVHAISTLTCDALHLSLLPVLIERFLQRVVQYEPILGMNMLGIYMGVPVVSMSSILQLMNGQPVTNQEEREAMRKFVESSISENNAVQYLGMDGFQTAASSDAGESNLLPGYVTCAFLRDNFVQAQGASFSNFSFGGGGGGHGGGGASGGGGGGGGGSGANLGNMSAQGIPLDPINAIVRKIYEDNSKVLKICGFVDDFYGFQRCIQSLGKDPFDLRDFFGGMSAYHDGQQMAAILGVRSEFKFASDFVIGKDGVGDPIMLPARIPRLRRTSPSIPLSSSHYQEADYCISVRVWDALLWFAITQRPRRDFGILTDFVNTLTECVMQLLPRSIFPYDLVPMTRTDPIERSQVLMDTQFQLERYGGHIMRPAVIPRHHNTSITTPHFTLQCSGRVGTKVLEDEMYMSSIIMWAEYLGIKWDEFPVDQVPTLGIHWEYGVYYPVSRFFDFDLDRRKERDEREGEEAEEEEDNEYDLVYKEFLRSLRPFAEGVVYLNPDRRSMMLFLSSGNFGDNGADSMQTIQIGSELFVSADGGPTWSPHIQLIHEFTLLPDLEPFGVCAEASGAGYNKNTLMGGVTLNCSSMQDMQNRLFKLGFGPMPYLRRPGVLVHISPDEGDDDDPSKYRLGCIVSHSPGVRNCCRNSNSLPHGCDDDDDDVASTPLSGNAAGAHGLTEGEKCYFCGTHPFYEMLFHNPQSTYSLQNHRRQEDGSDCDTDHHEARSKRTGEDEREGWCTVPISPNRAFYRVIPVGSKLLVTMESLASILPGFDPMHQTHLVKKMQARMAEQHRINRLRARSGAQNKENNNENEDASITASKRRRRGDMSVLGKHDGNADNSSVRALQRMNHQNQRTRKMSMLMSVEHAASLWNGRMESSSRNRLELKRLVMESKVRCYLNVSSVLSCRDGFACVAVSFASAGAKNAGKDVRNLYVAPQHLLIPEDDRQWEASLAHIII